MTEEQVNGVEEGGNNEPEAVHAEEVQGNPSQAQASPLSRLNGSNLSDNDADEEEEEGDELSSEEEKGAGSDDEPEVVTPRIVRKLESDLESTAFTRISCKSVFPHIRQLEYVVLTLTSTPTQFNQMIQAEVGRLELEMSSN